jgi:hypothetical protein
MLKHYRAFGRAMTGAGSPGTWRASAGVADAGQHPERDSDGGLVRGNTLEIPRRSSRVARPLPTLARLLTVN